MQKEINIKSKDGGEFYAYAAYPDTNIAAPAVVVIQEIFGVNDNMRGICDNLARAGFLAVCPDLFWRQQPRVELSDQVESDWQKAFEFYKGFDVDLGVEDLKAALSAIRKDKTCSGLAGSMGFCLGGKLAYLMATRSNADCNVSYYGVGIEEMLGESDKIKHPLLMHIAEKDQYVPLPAQKKILDALNKNKKVTIDVYPEVDHAFARVGGKHYDKEAAHMANTRTADFLATHLAKKRN